MRALFQPLSFKQLAIGAELVEPHAQFFFDAFQRLGQGGPRRHIMRIGINLHAVELARRSAGQGIEFADGIDIVAEKFDPPSTILVMCRENIDHIAAHAESAARKGIVVAPVLQGGQIAHQLHAVQFGAFADRHRRARIRLHRTDAVNARHAGHDDHIVAFQNRPRRRMAHAIDLFVYRGILFDIGVGARDIGFRLVVIVIGNEILHRVFGEEVFHLGVKLRGQRFVGRQDQRRLLHDLDHLRHGEGFARAGDAQQHLIAFVGIDGADQFGDGGGLIARRFVFADQLEGFAAFGLLRPRRAMRDEAGDLRAGHQAEAFRGFCKAALWDHTVVVRHGSNIMHGSGLCSGSDVVFYEHPDPFQWQIFLYVFWKAVVVPKNRFKEISSIPKLDFKEMASRLTLGRSIKPSPRYD